MIIDLSGIEEYRAITMAEAYAIIDELQTDLVILSRKLDMQMRKLQNTMVEQFAGSLVKLGKSVADTFRVDSIADFVRATEIFGTEFAASLYGVTLRFEQFRVGLARIAQPIVQLLLPVVQVAVDVLSGLANALAQAVSWLFAGAGEADAFADNMLGAATAATSLKRTLAGFDQLNRLGGSNGTVSGLLTPPKLSDQWQKVADKLKKLMEPLKNIDLTPAAESFKKLTAALEPIKKELFAGLEWALNNVFIPLAQWTAEKLLPAFLDMLAAAAQALGRVIEEVKPMLSWLWEECLKPMAAWAGDQVIGYLQNLTKELTGFGEGATGAKDPVAQLVTTIENFITALGRTIQSTLELKSGSGELSEVIGGLLGAVADTTPLGIFAGNIEGVANVMGQLAEKFGLVDQASGDTFNSLNGLWSQLWTNLQQKMMDPTYAGMKNGINSLIGLTNGVLQSTAGGINGITRSINKLSFTVPSWIPVLGGKKFGFDLKTIYPTAIPYLARGAVLPANKPFMAVVGDQRHGTNVEAPLTTIQQAVSEVMEDRFGGVMAGFQAVTERQERLLQAVLGLDLSDSAIAGAADRYRNKLSVINGGY